MEMPLDVGEGCDPDVVFHVGADDRRLDEEVDVVDAGVVKELGEDHANAVATMMKIVMATFASLLRANDRLRVLRYVS